MPTYFVRFSNFKLSKTQRNNLAKGITKIHSDITGANKFFAQVYFEEYDNRSHYMGGKINKNAEIFLYGTIRAGRSDKIKNKLLLKLRDEIKKGSNLKEENVWVYLIDLPPSQMIEYGKILPNSGDEKKWFKNLPTKLKKRLLGME
tara:strand:+ start:599 stop:1036 length:438 start_codon:yes stop_codon:yes gene_type:complete